MDKFNDLLAQHQMYAYRAGTQAVNEALLDYEAYAQKLRAEMAKQLDGMSQADIRAFTNGSFRTAKAKALRDSVNERTQDLIDEFGSAMNNSGIQYAAYESEWLSKTVTALAKDYETVILKGSEIYSKAMKQPVIGYLFDDTLMDIRDSTKRRIFANMRTNISNGATNDQIVKSIFGTKQFDYKDGVLNVLKTALQREVRTVRNHLANTAYEETTKALGFKKVQVSATLDFRTCKDCAQLDGNVYDIDDPSKPDLPRHPNTRTVYKPYDESFSAGNRPFVIVHKDEDGKFKAAGKLSKSKREKLDYEAGQVSGKTTYKDWFARQDASFQREWLGDTKYKLYKEGGMTIDRFTDPTGKTLTLAELRIKDAEAFKRAGL